MFAWVTAARFSRPRSARESRLKACGTGSRTGAVIGSGTVGNAITAGFFGLATMGASLSVTRQRAGGFCCIAA